MPVPLLEPNGLLPDGEHLCVLSEIRDAFAYNSERMAVWNDLLRYLEKIRKFERIKEIYLDGSFTTDVAVPGDIDVVVEFDSIIAWVLLQTEYPQLFDPELISKEYKLDVYPHAFNLREGEKDYIETFKSLKIEECRMRNLPPSTVRGILVVKYPFAL